MPKRPIDPVDRHVGARVRQARLLAQKSQEWLGGQLDLTFQQVQKYEKGVNRIAPSRLQKIATVFGRPVSWFYDGVAQGDLISKPADDPFVQLSNSPDGIRLARAFNALHDRALRAALVATIEAAATLSDRDFARERGAIAA